ncbi:hypothetical protein QNI19_21960 [Cytophagaceae bacterium DM2B3-1]|uniref:Quinol oxidase subunit 4 n=1 Tax=Xanthocytophaga flava TaxID=3048013 RepID=A0AAE3QNV9_9BACT|nr:hypothetical protein [Xanthocytophaga flavus]MDJ1468760.1 hypothetical protein [Xanthocytophaga flavus]MDJ1480144.1 hypothetical protein [Xanthocytophaga flavus]MDJ1495620.1 hypothetical protein [Xanthocytophaga flavus]
MKTSIAIVLILITAVACTSVDPAHSGKKAYAAKAPRNKSAWK